MAKILAWRDNNCIGIVMDLDLWINRRVKRNSWGDVKTMLRWSFVVLLFLFCRDLGQKDLG